MILAGGASRRMGTAKALLQRRPGTGDSVWDKTLVRHAVDIVLECASAVYVVHAPDPASDLIRACAGDSRIRLLADRASERGPLVALADAWTRIRDLAPDSVLLVAPTDLPGLTVEPLRACLDAIRTQPHVDAVLVRREGRLQPLLGCYRAWVGAHLQAAVAAGQTRIREAVESLAVHAIDSEANGWPAWWTRPVHTPAEYEQWLSQWRDGDAT